MYQSLTAELLEFRWQDEKRMKKNCQSHKGEQKGWRINPSFQQSPAIPITAVLLCFRLPPARRFGALRPSELLPPNRRLWRLILPADFFFAGLICFVLVSWWKFFHIEKRRQCHGSCFTLSVASNAGFNACAALFKSGLVAFNYSICSSGWPWETTSRLELPATKIIKSLGYLSLRSVVAFVFKDRTAPRWKAAVGFCNWPK